ncbi:MAG: lamin tail domain-containing protein [Saprospiraceae bacterium]|nr:lamin tail domain-containing protein [Saprospiraceae bacterium]
MKILNIIAAIFLTATLISSCVKDEIFDGPAAISNVAATPVAPKSTESVTLGATVIDLKGVVSVNLLYRTTTGGTFTTVPMASGASHTYQAVIPAFPKDTKVGYYIEVKNIGGFTTLYPSEAPSKLAEYTVGASTLVKLFINEVFSDGTKDATDPDWVEIYNDSDIPVDLSGYSFYDEGIKTGAKPKRILNAGTVIPSKGFHVESTEYTEGKYAVEFGLSSTGDAVYLENTSGVLVASMDFLTINLSGKKSYGRKPDGSATLVIFDTPTKGKSNN